MIRVLAALAAVLLLALLPAGCGHSPPARSAGHQLALTKCGGCHLRPAPGAHERAFLARKLALEHATRVPLTDVQRQQIVEYLGRPSASCAVVRRRASPSRE